MSLRIGSPNGGTERRFDSKVQSADAAAAVAENSATARRLSAIVDPSLLVVRLEIQTERITRFADRDWLRRYRVEIHHDRSVARRDGELSTFHHVCVHARHGDGAKVLSLARMIETVHGLRPTSESARDRAELMLRWKRGPSDEAVPPTSNSSEAFDGGSEDTAPFLNPELSLLAFQSRVLALAENPETPLRERLRFLSIVSSNIDEFYMIRVAGLKQAAREQSDAESDDGLKGSEQLRSVRSAVASLVRRQSACAVACLSGLELAGVRIARWADLSVAQREQLRRQCVEQIHPDLTPMAMTLSPGHRVPHLGHLALALAVARRDPDTRRLHLAELELPADTPRFLAVPGSGSDVVAIEEIVRSNIDLVHPSGGTEGVYVFRVTRGGELALDEEAAEDLIEAVADATGRRTSNPAVRIEVERGMPGFLRDLLMENLQREDPSALLDPSDVHEMDGLLDLSCLARLALPSEVEGYPPFEPSDPLPAGASMLDAMRETDLFFHHPFDSFAATVTRFIREASEDPDVTTIRMTLYRMGASSAVGDALIHAAKNGKKVIAFVELKARFDEDHNVRWARKLERAGGHVVSGIVGFKNHAKVAMIVRREDSRLRSYVHIGTGNYNSRSGREYTDFSLFSTRDDIAQDATDLFSALTGGSLPPRGLSRGSLVAPHQMADSLIALIDREAANARSGRASGIRIKVNGLSDGKVARALLRAASDGVSVDIICRGVCTLRPGVPGVSERVKVISCVGRFLEHSRAYRFENAGEPVHFIGSADLRQRNLRRRVELLVPVREPSHKEDLDRILDLYLNDPTAWDLDSSGKYSQGESGPSEAQKALIGSAGPA